MNVNRRQFLSGCLATAATGCAVGAAAGGCKGRDAAGIDPDLSVLVSDVHVPQPWSEQKYRTGREYPWIVGQIRRFVDEILAMRPRPAHVFGFGDMSIAFSEEREYEIAETLFRPLADAGIELVLTVGNHDLREPFMKHLGKWAGKTPVPGRVASVTSLPHFDLVLLDSLKEPKPEDRGKYDALTGCDLGRKQRKWLEDFLASSKRPVILGAHHSAKQAGVDKLVVRSPNVFGYIHGHHHKWDRSYLS
ncbi:MAG: metallophosphoesterase [Kiritimatiellae bacterium]|nr:metallophosphoesterase [Kiritimatiellia bacterium]